MNEERHQPVKSNNDDIKYSIVVPVYNSEKTLPLLYERLIKVMESLETTFEILFVEDEGRDGSWEVLCNLAKRDKRISAIQLMRNQGQARATMCGLRHSAGQFVVTIDDDLQHPPEEIPVLIKALKDNSNMDVIIGIPYEKKHALWRNLGSQFVNIINTYVFKKSHSLKFSGFRVIRRQIVDCLIKQNVPQPAVGVLLLSITPRIQNVYVRHEPREYGKSGYTLSKIFTLTLSNFLAFSIFPLRFLAICGVLGVFGSIMVGAVYLLRYLTGGIGVAGFTTIVLLLVGMGGFIFFAFGLVGEYLLRILQSVHFTPQYVVRQSVNSHYNNETGRPIQNSLNNQPVMQPEIVDDKLNRTKD